MTLSTPDPSMFPTESSMDLVAKLIWTNTKTPPRKLAAAILTALVGDEDNPGPLDRIRLVVADGLITWHCSFGCGQDGSGTAGVMLRPDKSQRNLTLGELVQMALTHEDEDH